MQSPPPTEAVMVFCSAAIVAWLSSAKSDMLIGLQWKRDTTQLSRVYTISALKRCTAQQHTPSLQRHPLQDRWSHTNETHISSRV